MVHFFALLFWVAGGLAFVAGLPQLGIAIFVVIVPFRPFSWRTPCTGVCEVVVSRTSGSSSSLEVRCILGPWQASC